MNLANNLILQKETRLPYMFYMSCVLLVAPYVLQIVNYEVVLEFPNPQSWSDMIE